MTGKRKVPWSDGDFNDLALEICAIFRDEKFKQLLEYRWNRLVDTAPDFVRSAPGWPKKEDDIPSMEQVFRMRMTTSRLWPSLGKDQQFELMQWIIQKWGGIGRTSNKSFAKYYALLSDINSGDGSRVSGAEGEVYSEWNVSGKSKFFAFVDPERFFVYDSRVSMALNAIILTRFGKRFEWEFFLAEGKSHDYDDKTFRHTLSRKRYRKAKYGEYCQLIRLVCKRMGWEGIECQRAEMYLFSLGQKIRKFKSILEVEASSGLEVQKTSRLRQAGSHH